MTTTKLKTRNLFRELMEGVAAMRAHREGRPTRGGGDERMLVRARTPSRAVRRSCSAWRQGTDGTATRGGPDVLNRTDYRPTHRC
jgi:hypothetical protein